METATGAAGYQLDALSAFWAPPERLTVSEWADKSRRLSTKSSARSGEWRTRPYQREPMDEFTNPRIHTIVLMVARQTLKTEAINNCLGYVIDKDPGPILVVQFRDTDCQKFSKIRLMPMIQETPCLAAKVADAKSKVSGNTIDYKEFAGGHLSIVASGSPGNLAALPIRYLFCDEIDKYPASAGAAGDPISLAQGRQEEFWNRKTVLACTPTFQGASRIEAAWLESDQREYELCCPICGSFQIPCWRTQVRWNSDLPRHLQPGSAKYHCAACDAAWGDVERWKASKTGQYRATAPFNGTAGFRVSGLARLGTKLSAMVDEFLKAAGNKERLKTFINEQLAELWTEPGEVVEWRHLLDRREEYAPRIIPMGGLFLTAGCDVQRADGGRIEVEILAHGENRETWSVDYRFLYGDPTLQAVWDQLEDVLHERFLHESGAELGIEKMLVDSGDGTTTKEVYEWVQKQPRGVVWATKGDNRTETPVSGPRATEFNRQGKKTKYGAILRTIAVDVFKSTLYADLKKRRPTDEELAQGFSYPQGYCHFPLDSIYGDEYFKQLCAERLITKKTKRGGEKTEYEQTRPRNEALDCRIYNMAGAWIHGSHRFQPSHWKLLKQRLAMVDKSAEPAKPKSVNYIEQIPVQVPRQPLAGRPQRPRTIPSPYL